MPDKPTVYVVDDDDASRDSLAFLLKSAKLPVKTFESADDFLAAGVSHSGCCIVTGRFSISVKSAL